MDRFGQLPLTLVALEARLRRGEVFTIPGEDALLTLLDCLGEFSRPSTSQSQGKHEL